MAEKAQAEPTMEEILASIRKIISDEGEGPRPSSPASAKKEEPKVSVNVSDDEDFEELSLDDVIEQAGVSQDDTAGDTSLDAIADDADDDLLNDVDESMFDDLSLDEAATPSDTPSDPLEGVDDLSLEDVTLDDEEPVFARADEPAEAFGGDEDQSDEEWEDEWGRDIPATDEAPAVEPAVVHEPVREETTMLRGKTEAEASSATAGAGLTDERIAGAAASALGKLMVKQSQEAGNPNPNTLEGLMMELLRPMIKEWLDANLPAIVERKVEEEVQRIARMAR